MKRRLITLITSISLALSLSACGRKPADTTSTDSASSQAEDTTTDIRNIFQTVPYNDVVTFGDVAFTIQAAADDALALIMKQGTKSTTLFTSKSLSAITNGQLIYFAMAEEDAKEKDGLYEQTIYLYDLQDQSQKKLFTGMGYVPVDCKGHYFYYAADQNADGKDLYVYNQETEESTHIVDHVGDLRFYGNRVITTTQTGAPGNYPLHIFNIDGSKKLKFANGTRACVIGHYIYYTVLSKDKTQVKRYNLESNNTKTLTEPSKKDVFLDTVAQNIYSQRINKAVGTGIYEERPAENIFDKLATTCWNANPVDGGINDVITVMFKMSDVTTIDILNGNHASYKDYDASSRVRKITLMFEDGKETHELTDQYGTYQTIVLDQTHTCEKVSIKIESVYPGSQTPENVCLSEVVINAR